jgi:hypothetical protein
MKEMGLKGHSVGVRSFNINDNIFDSVDDQEKAYWLGFLLADGCLAKSAGTRRSLKLCLKAGDVGHLKLYQKWIGHKGKLHFDGRDGHPRYSVLFNSVSIGNRLVEMGWLDYKNKGDIRILQYIPKHLTNHYIRGFFDGDGCIGVANKKKNSYTVTIVSKFEEPLRWISAAIKRELDVDRDVKKRTTVYSLVYNGNLQIMKVMDWLYNDAMVYLDRKFGRFQQLKSRYISKDLHIEWNGVCDFSVNLSPKDIAVHPKKDAIVKTFTNIMLNDRWRPPTYKNEDLENDLSSLKACNISKYFSDEGVKEGRAYGNTIIKHFQPEIWSTRQNNKPTISEYMSKPKLVKKAVKTLLTSGNRIYPDRLLRELQFVGLSRASLLSVPVIMAAIKKFRLVGTWVDPCAGWGHRLLAAHVLNYRYIATDPGKPYKHLQNIIEFIGSNAEIHESKFEDFDYPRADFCFTSPPFYDREDYGLGPMEYKFDEWCDKFIYYLIDKMQLVCDRVVFHIPDDMVKLIEHNHIIIKIPYQNRGMGRKMQKQWFVEIRPKNL